MEYPFASQKFSKFIKIPVIDNVKSKTENYMIVNTDKIVKIYKFFENENESRYGIKLDNGEFLNISESVYNQLDDFWFGGN